jgi:hydrogenase-4 membrane subunit HyfE
MKNLSKRLVPIGTWLLAVLISIVITGLIWGMIWLFFEKAEHDALRAQHPGPTTKKVEP